MSCAIDILYVGIFSSGVAYTLQILAQKESKNPTMVSLLLSLESVFGVIFSVILYHEQVTLRMFAGFAVIFAAILLSQWEGKKQPCEQGSEV